MPAKKLSSFPNPDEVKPVLSEVHVPFHNLGDPAPNTDDDDDGTGDRIDAAQDAYLILHHKERIENEVVTQAAKLNASKLQGAAAKVRNAGKTMKE